MSKTKTTAHPFPYLMTGAEKQSGQDRVLWAEGLIMQLPDTHDGRNSWLLNYGVSDEAQALRAARKLPFLSETRSAPNFGGVQ